MPKLLFIFLPLLLLSCMLSFAQGGNVRRAIDSLHSLYRGGFKNPGDLKNPRPFYPALQTGEQKLVTARPARLSSNRPNAICFDTSGRFFLENDSLFFYTYNPVPSRDGNLFLSGSYHTYGPPYKNNGALIKCDYEGNIIFTRLYDTIGNMAHNAGMSYYTMIELMDGSLLLAGGVNNPITNNSDILLTRTDNLGNIIWSRTYKSRIWTFGSGSADYFYITDLKQDPSSGDIYLCGPHWAAGKALGRFSLATGDVLWSKLYDYGGLFDRPFGMLIRSNDILYFGKFSGSNRTYLTVHRINKLNGDTLATKVFATNDVAGYHVEFLESQQVIALNNGNIRLSGNCYGNYQFPWNGITPLKHAAFVDLDANLNFVSAFALQNPIQSNGYNTQTTIYPDGTGFFTMLRYISGFVADIYYVQFRDGLITKQRQKIHSNEGFPTENRAIKTPDGADMIVKNTGDSAAGKQRLQFIKLHVSDTASLCLGYDDSRTSVYPITYSPVNIPLDSIGNNIFVETYPRSFSPSGTGFTKLPICRQVSHCDTLMLLATDSVICPGQNISITIRKNPECGALAPLEFNTSVVSAAVQVNDSTFTLTFSQQWTGHIYASLQGCTLFHDSIPVRVLQAPAQLNIGPDSVLCPGNTILLNARSGYASYLWQDGSSDSAFLVTEPGTYHVTTTDACGSTYRDTVRINPHAPIPLSIGPDRSKCNSDTIHLSATTGFLNYSWSPGYNINSTSLQQVVVNPSVDTIYTVMAEKTPGCFAYDTVRIRVYHSPAITLGADTSLCQSDTLFLDAGPGFSSWNWNTGISGRHLQVSDAGNYFVTATTIDGCKSSDTIRVLNVFSLPQVQLNPDTTLCMGATRTLDAGNGFTNYLWNTGATTQTIPVSGTGIYAVIVTDQHLCTGTDTTRISTILPTPKDFLPGDTAICSYGQLQLSPLQTYPAYQWSTGSQQHSVTIAQPGVYWLQVIDASNCQGRDSITVNPKECLKGFYIPTGFTPNNDGRNDSFKPFIFGIVKQYRFSIYNRWGQLVFETRDLLKGWDGRLGGLPQDSNVYAWTCLYQLEGEPPKLEKGTVVLLR